MSNDPLFPCDSKNGLTLLCWDQSKKKDQRVKELCDNAEETGRKYLGRDDFAAKYILKVHAHQQRRRNK